MRAATAAFLVSGCLTTPALALPPAGYFPFGTMVVESVSKNDGNLICGIGAAVASQLWANGNTEAWISFDSPIGYDISDANGGGSVFSALLGSVAELDFSTNRISFDIVATGGSGPFGPNTTTFGFSIQQDGFNDTGLYELDFTIELPNCSVPVRASWQP
jgi:hypothetical protein